MKIHADGSIEGTPEELAAYQKAARRIGARPRVVPDLQPWPVPSVAPFPQRPWPYPSVPVMPQVTWIGDPPLAPGPTLTAPH